ncbi:MAG TPA: [Fe-Fe] hydrogenase large subunit C-terminal domain-containing protein [bacterium]|nr:[Fe-Fe] hydrogenase large subunit C-terminal domain-containing protein [bacterium]HPN43381.1 [Fe-Fe] hydrogenase large subunit C-terminal domain-containing protein [bacterium]
MPVVWTIEEKCKRCYSCIRECPAKAIKVENGQAKVIEERCLACGHCVNVCSQKAKAVLNGVDNTLRFLKQGETIAMLAPSFPAAYPKIEMGKLIGALRESGFSRVVEVAFGADLINRAYLKMVNDKNNSGNRPFITSSCPAICSLIEKYFPELIGDLAPIVSPMVAMGRVVKKMYGDNVKVVFIGPCTAKKTEIMDPEVRDSTDEVLTFQELTELWDILHIDPQTARWSDFDPPIAYLGSIYPISGGFLRSAGLPLDIMNKEVILTEGKEHILRLFECLKNQEIRASMVDVLFCEGCINGPLIDKTVNYFTRKQKIVQYTAAHRQSTNYMEWKSALEQFKDVKVFREFTAKPLTPLMPTEKQVRLILEKIEKFASSDELNCRACGYDTCREYAAAVFQGLAEDDMCLPYLIEKQQRMQQELKNSLAKLAEAQEQLIQHEKLASIGQLAAGVAHEVNNPLGSIMLYAHLVLQRMEESDSRSSDIKFIMEEAKRCQKIVSGLLNFSRQGKLRLKQHNIRNIINKMITALKEQKLFQNVEIFVNIADSVPEISMDGDQMYQVFLNLALNAAEAMPNGGSLTITARPDFETNRVVIEFMDNGVGIPKENLSKMFTPFFTTKQIGKGTGLGLPIAYGILKMHKGNIQVKSNVGLGSVFIIDLPMVTETVQSFVGQ